jgi:hypothetical protein
MRPSPIIPIRIACLQNNFHRSNQGSVRQNRFLERSRQKPRFLPAAARVMSAKIASCDFGQSN